MKNESHATKRLVDSKSKVSSHYLIRNDGKILVLVPDLYIAWHAGVSSWKKYKFLNKNSIGIEISNPGHNFYYKKFSSTLNNRDEFGNISGLDTTGSEFFIPIFGDAEEIKFIKPVEFPLIKDQGEIIDVKICPTNLPTVKNSRSCSWKFV